MSGRLGRGGGCTAIALRLYQLPGCDACARTAAWLTAAGIAHEARHIRNCPPGRAELAAIAELLPGGPGALIAPRSIRYRELGLAGRVLEPEALLDLLAAEPRLLRRPILFDPDRPMALVGSARQTLEAALAPSAG